MANILFNNTLTSLLKAKIDFSTISMKLMLLTSSYVPNINQLYSDIIAYNAEVSGSGYIPGGERVWNTSIVNETLVGNNVSWNNVTFNDAKWALLYIDNSDLINTPNDAIAVFDFWIPISVSAKNIFTIPWGSSGKIYGNILKFSQRTIIE